MPLDNAAGGIITSRCGQLFLDGSAASLAAPSITFLRIVAPIAVRRRAALTAQSASLLAMNRGCPTADGLLANGAAEAA